MMTKAPVFVAIVLSVLTAAWAFVPQSGTPKQQQKWLRTKEQRLLSVPRFLKHSVSDRKLIKSSSTSTSTSLNMDLNEVLYNFESVANNWATVSLKDPSNLVTSLPIMYGAGLLTSVSPCVWGLLPVTLSYISNAASEREDQQTLLPTLAFAAGLAVVFCALGVTAAELGGVFGSAGNGGAGTAGTSTLVLSILSNGICFAMGLKLLELIEIPLPSLDIFRFKRQSLVSGNAGGNGEGEPILIDATGQIMPSSTAADEKQQRNKESGALFRTFLLGGSSALIGGQCATPVLASILAFVASAQNPALGGVLLFGYTLGYSTPLLVIASTGGQALAALRGRQRNHDTEPNGEAGDNPKRNVDLYARIAPWVTPITGGILLGYGTNGMLTALFGDPSLAGLTILD